MKKLIVITALFSILASHPAAAWDRYSRHHSHNHRDADAAVALVGGLVLGAALAESLSSNHSNTYSASTVYYSDYPSQISSRSTYYSRPYYSERVYEQEPIHTTTYYSAPVTRTHTTTQTRYHYPARKPVERVYYDDTIRDERGNCYSVEYRNGRKTLREIARYHCYGD
jgi:hypothetical protein